MEHRPADDRPRRWRRSNARDRRPRPTARGPRNHWSRIFARVAVSLGFLGLLFWRLPEVQLDELFPSPTPATWVWIAAAVGVHLVAYLLQNLRWSAVSDTLGIPLGFRRLFGHLLAGEFVSNALPTSFGGDVVRVMRQGHDVGDYAESFAATSLERLTGWLVLPDAVAVGPSALGTGYLSLGAASTVAVLTDVLTFVALLGPAVGRRSPRGVDWSDVPAGATWAPSTWASSRSGRRAQAVRVLSTAGVGFSSSSASACGAARALRIDEVTLVASLAFFPPTAVLQNFPSPSGPRVTRGGVRPLLRSARGQPLGRSAWACWCTWCSCSPAWPAHRASPAAASEVDPGAPDGDRGLRGSLTLPPTRSSVGAPMEDHPTTILDTISSPDDLAGLDGRSQLTQLAAEIREFIVDTVNARETDTWDPTWVWSG